MSQILVLLGVVPTVALATPVMGPEVVVPFLKVISASTGAPGRVACRDMDLSMAMKKGGLSPDAKAPVAWAASKGQLEAYLAEGKLVVAGDPAFLEEGAAIVVTKEGGRPVLLISQKNLAASGVGVSDALLKIAKVR